MNKHVVILLCLGGSVFAADHVKLASAGKAKLPIIVTSSNQLTVANELAGYLQRITGANFEVKAVEKLPDDPAIVIATAKQFPELPLTSAREHYIIRSTGNRLLLVGVTDLAAQHAVYRLLEEVGCRWFFPGPTWEIIPKTPELSVNVDLNEKPDYLTRTFVGGGSKAWGKENVGRDWAKHNRMADSIKVSCGDGAYGRWAAENKDEFKKHPEYLALVDGKRTPKGNLCVSNPDLRALGVASVLKALRGNPKLESISTEPNDSPVWCECDACKKMGSPADRTVIWANEIGDAVAKEFPGKTVGIYAYSAHQLPPTVKVHSNVYVAVATSFLRGLTHEQLLQGWRAAGANLAVREYSSVYIWDFSIPANSRAANLTYWREKIPHWHKTYGINVFLTEHVASWGIFGLGNYVANKLLWDVDTNVDAVVDDFLKKSFGRGAETMRTFYKMIDSNSKPELCDDYMGKLYRCLAEARRQESDPGVHARLNDLTLYLRYVDYYTDYQRAQHDPRLKKADDKAKATQAAFEQMLRFTWKIRSTGMVDTYSNWRWLQRFGGFAWPEGEPIDNVLKDVRQARAEGETVDKEANKKRLGLTWQTPEDKHPWKEKGTFTAAEIEALNDWGVKEHPLLGVEPVTYSTELVPAGFASTATNEVRYMTRNNVYLYIWKDKDQPLPTLTLSAGHVYFGGKPLPWNLYDATDKLVESGEVPKDEKDYRVEFRATAPGLYRFAVEDAGSGTAYAWPANAKISISTSGKYPAKFNYALTKQRLYFYVPKKTEKIVIFRTANVQWKIHDPAGKLVFTSEPENGHIAVPVPPTQRGAVWSILNAGGRNIKFLTTPPVVAFSPAGLLLPKELLTEIKP